VRQSALGIPTHQQQGHSALIGDAACIVSLVDRLVHNAEVIAIDGDSYRLKEATERADQRARQRRAPSS
jgi:IstB-like ATP binding protein